MQYYGHAEQVAKSILDAFKSGNVPAALSTVFIHRKDCVPCRQWSFSNQFITAWIGQTNDARGFRQWQDVGRKVSKGSKAFFILVPLMGKKEETTPTGETKTKMVLYGFKSAPVFAVEKTEIIDPDLWAETQQVDSENVNYILSLPLKNVADSWGLSVNHYDGRPGAPLGSFSPGTNEISLATKNLTDWLHELTHAADYKNKTILISRKQELSNEIVADLGAATLALCLDKKQDADLGGVWNYITHYSKDTKENTIQICSGLLDRVCGAVALILDTAETIKSKPAEILAA